MSWFKTSDDFTQHPGYERAGKDARALLFHVGIECARRNTDGAVWGHKIREWMAAAEVTRTAARRLVQVGLWHDAKSLRDCSACLADIEDLSVELEPSDFYWCGWRADQIEKEGKDDPVKKKRNLRKKALHRNQPLKAQIRERDRDLCRYCGVLTTWGADHKSSLAGTFDHIDPWSGNSLSNCCVSCRRCNGVKRDRTPEQARMPLHDPGFEADIQPDDPDFGSDTQPESGGSEPANPGSSSRDARDGPGTGPGTGSGPDAAGFGSDRAGFGSGPGPVGVQQSDDDKEQNL